MHTVVWLSSCQELLFWLLIVATSNAQQTTLYILHATHRSLYERMQVCECAAPIIHTVRVRLTSEGMTSFLRSAWMDIQRSRRPSSTEERNKRHEKAIEIRLLQH